MNGPARLTARAKPFPARSGDARIFTGGIPPKEIWTGAGEIEVAPKDDRGFGMDLASARQAKGVVLGDVIPHPFSCSAGSPVHGNLLTTRFKLDCSASWRRQRRIPGLPDKDHRKIGAHLSYKDDLLSAGASVFAARNRHCGNASDRRAL
jgi:hypothetical protein